MVQCHGKLCPYCWVSPWKHAFTEASFKIDPISLLYEQWGQTPWTLTHSCYAAKLWGRQQTKLVQLKTFTWFSPPPPPKMQNKNVNKRRQEELGVFFGCGRGHGGEGKKGEGKAVPFCLVCLHHQIGIPGIQQTCPLGQSCASSLMLSICALAVLSCTVRVVWVSLRITVNHVSLC